MDRNVWFFFVAANNKIQMSWSVPKKYRHICDGSEQTDSDFHLALEFDSTTEEKVQSVKALGSGKLQQQHFCRDLMPPKMMSVYSSPNTTQMQAVKLQAALLVKNRWKQYQHLRIKFMGGSEDDRKWVREVVEKTYTPALMNLTLEWLSDDNSKLSDIRISFTPDGSWSYLGTECLEIPQNEPTMNLAWLDRPSDSTTTVLDGGVIKHEFGHCLGPWIHEHQNPNGNPTKWNVPVVVMSLRGPPNYWTDQDICTNIFPRYLQDQLRGTQYDPDSIMQYFYPPTWVEDGKGTQVNQFLSQKDKDFLKKTYPPGGPTESEIFEMTNTIEDTRPDDHEKLRLGLIITSAVLIFGILVAASFLVYAIMKCKKVRAGVEMSARRTSNMF